MILDGLTDLGLFPNTVFGEVDFLKFGADCSDAVVHGCNHGEGLALVYGHVIWKAVEVFFASSGTWGVARASR